MGGLEEILKQIDEETQAEISEIISQARKKCEKIKAENIEQIGVMVEEKNRQSDLAAMTAFNKLRLGGETKKRQEILRAKQQLIVGVIAKAHDRLKKLDKEDYFNVLLIIVKKYAHKENGVVKLNENDLKRIPEKVAKELKNIGLEVSKTPVDIEDGMILCYGDIEENCTFKALINEKKDMLQDKINRFIFE